MSTIEETRYDAVFIAMAILFDSLFETTAGFVEVDMLPINYIHL